MDGVIRAAVVYFGLLTLFRLTGKRSLGQVTTFDFVLLLIISETVQNALVGKDHSMTHAFLLVVTLVGLDIGLSLLKHRSPFLDLLIEGAPVPLIRRGKILQEHLDKERIDSSDVMSAAREKQGLVSMEEIEHAVLEKDGQISIMPRRRA
jgi:uncharacterized membrane protein YcaP (DUF421 family)